MVLFLKSYIYNMNPSKHLVSSILILILIFCLFQCSSTLKLEKKAPIEFSDVYCQSWNTGTKEGGSGVNIFIKIMDTSVVLDNVYFRGKATKLQINPSIPLLYVGRFTSKANRSNNNLINASKTPFKLKDSECVISYLVGKKNHYFKISNITVRETINYPSHSLNKQ